MNKLMSALLAGSIVLTAAPVHSEAATTTTSTPTYKMMNKALSMPSLSNATTVQKLKTAKYSYKGIMLGDALSKVDKTWDDYNDATIYRDFEGTEVERYYGVNDELMIASYSGNKKIAESKTKVLYMYFMYPNNVEFTAKMKSNLGKVISKDTEDGENYYTYSDYLTVSTKTNKVTKKEYVTGIEYMKF